MNIGRKIGRKWVEDFLFFSLHLTGEADRGSLFLLDIYEESTAATGFDIRGRRKGVCSCTFSTEPFKGRKFQMQIANFSLLSFCSLPIVTANKQLFDAYVSC